MEHFEVVQTWLLNSYNIKVSSEWLSACIEWIAQESEDQAQPVNALKEQVFEQWLNSDLTEIGEPSLPPAATTCDKYELINNYALQIISIVDVGFPLYGQQQKLTGRENVNAEVSAEKPFQPGWEPKQSRMLQLTLTDGHSEIKAMELKPIRTLHSQLPSGIKCVLMGTVMCRRGMILLTEDHIQLLGGEVDTLTEINSPLNVLQQAMEKNREDSGKHARQEFSGRVITQCSDKKINLKAKSPMVKTEDLYKKPQHLNRFQDFSQLKEVKPKLLSMSNVKEEEIKSKQDRDTCSTISLAKHEEEQWEEDISYSELFDNDMEFEDQPGSGHNSFKTVEKTDNSANISSPSLNALFNDRPNNVKDSDITTTVISSKQPIVKQEIFDISDEDMEIENVFNESEPFWHPKMQNSLSKGNSCYDRMSDKIPVESSKSDVSIAKQDILLQRMNSTSAQGCNKLEETVNFNAPSPTFTSPVSKPTSALSQSEKICLANKKKTPIQASFMQAKKPKVQAKLFDLFSKQSKTAVKSKEKNTNTVLISNKVFISQASNERHLVENSKASYVEKKSPSLNSSYQVSSQALGKSVVQSSGPKSDPDLKSLPKAVIQPFKPVSTTDEVCNDSINYGHLSDLQNLDSRSIKAKVSILTLIERLCSNNGSHWSLACKISDSITTLDVDISNGVLTGLIGFSAEDSIAMRQRFRAEPDVKEVFAEGLSQCQSKLISGRRGCIVELEPTCLNPRRKRPVIISFHMDPS